MKKFLQDKCSKFFTYEDLFHCGETWQKTFCENTPIQPASWQAYSQLATSLLDPIVDKFGQIELTFGFCGNQLRKLILTKPIPHISPKLDQHAAHELNRNGMPLCSRLGAAVDFTFPEMNAFDVAEWICSQLHFNRMYIYGKNLPLHISISPENTRQLILMETVNGRRMPRKLTVEKLKGLRMKE